ncbi:MAG TPA: cupin domain-containing protein [Nevskiaceae bacterium]|nr:cupin domain-containing protein [Nevskiaceae bacterium]
MADDTIVNPVTGERITFVETSSGTGGARTVGDLLVDHLGGVPGHAHDAHEERIEVLEGEIEVTVAGRKTVLRAGEHMVIPRGVVHAWRNPSREAALRFRGTMTPGHPGFETAIKVMFGLARDGEVRRNGVPKRLADMALIAHWNQGLPAGPLSLLKPFFAWAARRAEANGRAGELLRRYDAAPSS